MQINTFIFDVDGTLSDGTIFYGDNKVETKGFCVKDGLILRCLHPLGFNVFFLTGRESEAVQRRAKDLNATAIQGIHDKALEVLKLIDNYKIQPEQCAYIGDDLNDYNAMKLCRFKACPADAVTEVKAICDYVSPFPGGKGAVRDICEHLLREMSKYDEFLAVYGIYREAEK